MGGKAALFLVVGFSLIFMVVGRNISSISYRAVDNVADYYQSSNAYLIASVGANIAASKIFFDNTWNAGYSSVPFNGGKYDVTVEVIDAVRNITKITSIGVFGEGNEKVAHKIEVKLQPSSFSRYAYFSDSESELGVIWWTTRDTIRGPFHTNGELNISGDPEFYGKSTSVGTLNLVSGSNPTFHKGHSQRDSIHIPIDGVDAVGEAAQDDGLHFTNQDTVYLDFKRDSLTYKFGENDTNITVYLPDVSPNGAIFADGATVRMKGEIRGQYTVAASEGEVMEVEDGHYETRSQWVQKEVEREQYICWYEGRGWRRVRVCEWQTVTNLVWVEDQTEVWIPADTSYHDGGGNIYLDDDIVYETNPQDDSHSTDLLGIVSEKEVFITENYANNNNINIHAAIYSETQGFGAENYNSRHGSGNINLLGGITQKHRMPVGTFSTNPYTGERTINNGFNKIYNYDPRLMNMSPPFFPGTGNLIVVSWYE